MPAVQTRDHPGTTVASFSATLNETLGLPHNLTVAGEAVGDYRVQDVILVPAPHQAHPHILVLNVIAKLGPVESLHPEFEKIWPLRYTEAPAKHRYTQVMIVNGSQHFPVTVVFTL